MTVRIFTSPEALDSLRVAWERLESGAAYPTQQFAWMRACASTLANPGELKVVVVEDNRAVIAIAPLIQPRGKNILEFLGLSILHEPVDAIYAGERAAQLLAEALVNLHQPLFLERVPASSLLPAALVKAYKGQGMLISRPGASCPSFTIQASDMSPEGYLNAGRRSDLRRAQRKAAALGPVSCEIVSTTASNVESLLNEAIAVEAASWKTKAGSALAVDSVRRTFHQRYAKTASEKGIFRLAFLRIGGKVVAMQMAVETCGSYWLFKIGYDDQFSHCSPGTLLLCEVIRYCAERGLRSIEFLGVCEPWTQIWTRQETQTTTVRGYPVGFAGATRLANDVVRSIWKKIPVIASRVL